ncbi:MAG: hypothetical protein BHW58_00700 [Azospirillum sp. 51_20]|nr:MAG: hypothetical protein BHW58_00700 [Azospirillum sp. 51_20]
MNFLYLKKSSLRAAFFVFFARAVCRGSGICRRSDMFVCPDIGRKRAKRQQFKKYRRRILREVSGCFVNILFFH